MLKRVETTRLRSVALPIVFLVAAFIRFYNLGEKQLWLDEIIQVIHSTPGDLTELLLAVTEDRGAAPLDYLVQHVFITLLGTTEVTARLHAAIFGSLTVVAIYFFVRKIFDRDTAFLTALLYAVYPLHHHYSQEGRPYALFTFLTVCAFITFLNVLQREGKKYWVFHTLILVLLFYASYYGVFVIFAQLVFLGTLLIPRVQGSTSFRRQTDPNLIAKFVLSSAVAFACFVPWIVFGLKTIYGYETAPETFDLQLIVRLIRELSDRSLPLSILLIVLAAFGVRHLIKQQQYASLSLLLCWALLPLPLIFLLLWTREYFFAIRQILFMTPALYILVAVGIFYLAEIPARRREQHRFAVTAAITTLIVAISAVVIWLHIPDRNADFKSVSSFLEQNASPGDRVIAPVIHDVLGYYFPEIQNHSEDASKNLPLAAGQKIFIVESEYMKGADRDHVQQLKTNQNYVVEQIFDFRDVRVVQLRSR